MLNESNFKELLDEARVNAVTNGNEISVAEVQNIFKDLNLDKSKYELIYAFLESNNIKIKDHITSEAALDIIAPVIEEDDVPEEELEEYVEAITSIDTYVYESEKEKEFVEMYLEELESIKELSDDECKELAKKVLAGDSSAKDALIESQLKSVVSIAKTYRNTAIPISELIQEGNLGLIGAVNTLDSTSEDVTLHIYNSITKAIRDAIDMQDMSNDTATQLVEQINSVHNAVTELTKDLERRPTKDEVCTKLLMTAEELEDIVTLSTEDLGINMD